MKAPVLAGLLFLKMPMMAFAAVTMPQTMKMDPSRLLQIAQADLQNRAKVAAGKRFSYAMNVTDKSKETISFEIAYDPMAETGSKWSIVSPQKNLEDASYKAAQKHLDSVAKFRVENPDAKASDAQVIVKTLPGDDPAIFKYLRAENGYAIYGFDPGKTTLL